MSNKINYRDFKELASKIAVHLEGDMNHPLYSPCRELFHDNLVEYFKAASPYISKIEGEITEAHDALDIITDQANEMLRKMREEDAVDRTVGWEKDFDWTGND